MNRPRPYLITLTLLRDHRYVIECSQWDEPLRVTVDRLVPELCGMAHENTIPHRMATYMLTVAYTSMGDYQPRTFDRKDFQ